MSISRARWRWRGREAPRLWNCVANPGYPILKIAADQRDDGIAVPADFDGHCTRPFELMKLLYPSGSSGLYPLELHFGHGIPGAPQWQDFSSGPSHGRSGCASHTQRESRQSLHFGSIPSA
jgi:hypothetical protein